MEPSYIAGRSVKLYSHFGTNLAVPQSLTQIEKIYYVYTQEKTYVHTKMYRQMVVVV